jgi:hypothetical protein
MRRTLVVAACGLALVGIAVAGTKVLRAYSEEEEASAAADVPQPASVPATTDANEASVQPDPGHAVEVDMQNVDLRLTGGIVMHVQRLRGRFRPTQAAHPPFLDENDSYTVQIDGGRISVDMDSLERLLNQRVLGKGRSNVRNVRAEVDEGRLEQKGVMHKGLDLPFKTKGEVSATADGRIRMHTKSVKILGFLPVKPIMKLFSIEMDDVVKVKPGHGAVVQDNDIILDPGQMLPPPHMQGRIKRVWLEGNRVVQDFGPVDPLTPTPIGRNHIYWRGAHLRFGKLTMDGTDLELIDLDPDDPFDFSVDHWNDMLVGGFSKNTAQGGLKTYMPDYDDLKAGKTAAHTAK